MSLKTRTEAPKILSLSTKKKHLLNFFFKNWRARNCLSKLSMYYEEDDSDHFNGKNKCFRFNIKCFSSNNTNILFYYLNSILFQLRNKMFFIKSISCMFLFLSNCLSLGTIGLSTFYIFLPDVCCVQGRQEYRSKRYTMRNQWPVKKLFGIISIFLNKFSNIILE